MSQPTRSTKRKRNPLEIEVKPSTSGLNDKNKKKRTSGRKRKSSTKDPVSMSNDVKTKLKVRFSDPKIDDSTNEVLFGFDSEKEIVLGTELVGPNNSNDNFPKENGNKKSNNDVDEVIPKDVPVHSNIERTIVEPEDTGKNAVLPNIDIEQNALDQIVSNNERNIVQHEDTDKNVVLSNANIEQDALETAIIEITDANLDALNLQENQPKQNVDEAIDSCRYKMDDLANDNTNININSESSNEHNNEETIHVDKMCLHKDTVKEDNFTMETMESNHETFDKQNEKVNLPDKEKNQKRSLRKKTLSKSASKDKETAKDHLKDDPSCEICEQALNSDLKFYSGDPENGYDEELAIIDSRLLLFNGDEENVSREDTRAYNKITSYSVYCKNGHLCPFDSGLIERDVEIYFSGYVKPIYNDDPSIEDAVPGKNFGPIGEWWTTGFDVGEQPTLAFSTEVGDYILMEPSTEYKPFMQSVLIKILISKIVIEYLVYEPYATYEDLLNKLQNASTLYYSLPCITEDVLLQHAPFICFQVMSYDETAKPNEPLMIVAPCIRRLIDLSAFSFKSNITARPRRQYHERRTGEYRNELRRKLAKSRGDRSWTGQLVDSLLPDIEEKLIALSKPCTRNRCGSCDRCQRSSCKECEFCKEKKYENCPRRRCFYREVQEANDEDAEDSIDLSQLNGKSSINAFKDTINIFSCFKSNLSWIGDPLKIEDTGNIYYAAIKYNHETISVDDFVCVRSIDPNVQPQVVKVAYFWEDNVGLAHFHANLYWGGKNTVLGELARPNEIFSINKCNNMSVNCITKKAKVEERIIRRIQDKNKEINAKNLFCEKSYEPTAGYFYDLPTSEEDFNSSIYRCINCENQHLQNERIEPRLIDKLEEKVDKILYRAVKYNDDEYTVGNCVYLKPKSLYFQFPMLNQHGKAIRKINKKVDEEKYPELYRKAKETTLDSKFDVTAPFDIGQITEIFFTDKLYIKVKKLYRAENTHKNENLVKQTDINMLYWSNEVCTVAFSYVIRKCYVAHIDDLTMSVEKWMNLGPDRFYFKQIYHDKKFVNIKNEMYGCKALSWELPIDYPNVDAMLSLEIFAGCGGLSLGLRDAGTIKKIGWAIESDLHAANTLKFNNPSITVVVEHPDVILKNVVEDKYELNGIILPKKGDIEFLCATLPCENYKDMTDISIFKHSAIATFLSYCYYYKPALFVFEADEKLIKRSVVLKLTLACFVSMGYQVTFDLMQVGSYGAPQNRRRSVILGAAPGHLLPKFPQRLHVFPKSLCQLGIVIDNKKYTQDTFWTESAPYRSMTVRDALIDLPAVKVGSNEDLNYDAKSVSHFAKMMRLKMLEPKVSNHVCKDLGPLVECRITQIPLTIGSDWRNLPNIEIQLSDGTYAKKIQYNYDDSDAGKSSSGALRGVCNCASGKQCNPQDRQNDCLIPWHLVHSAKQNDHWVGIYSRLQWNGFFNGTITNPQPLGTQSIVLHPSQARPVSVRECTRAQGFPDDFLLPQNISIHDMYRIIGRASCPFLGRAIGHEISRSLASRHRK